MGHTLPLTVTSVITLQQFSTVREWGGETAVEKSPAMSAKTTKVHTLDQVISSIEIYPTDILVHLQNDTCRGYSLQ